MKVEHMLNSHQFVFLALCRVQERTGIFPVYTGAVALWDYDGHNPQ
jgi:hypothetical protein